MIKKALATAAVAVGLLAGASAVPAQAAVVGATVSNTNISAYAVSSCTTGYINATAYVTTKRTTSWSRESVGLYDGNYGSSYYKLLQGASFGYVGQDYFGVTRTFTWRGSTVNHGDQVVFFISTDGAYTLPVKVACKT